MHQLEIDRLRLRLFTPDDLNELSRIFGNPRVMRFLGKEGNALTREETEAALLSMIRHWQRNGFGRWAVVHKETEQLIGCAGLRSLEGIGELVYLLDEPFWGVGLASEIARACLRYGFEVQQMDHIIALCKPMNLASRHVLEKIGMGFEKDTVVFDLDVSQYTIMREDYRADQSVFIVNSTLE